MPLRPCLDCHQPSQGRRCPACQTARNREREHRRGSAAQRGLGRAHRAQRQHLIDQAGPITTCPRCGRDITSTNPITGEHGVARAHGGRQVTGLICRVCNSSMGATIRRSDQT